MPAGRYLSNKLGQMLMASGSFNKGLNVFIIVSYCDRWSRPTQARCVANWELFYTSLDHMGTFMGSGLYFAYKHVLSNMWSAS